jgi:hypothetical protein
MMMVLKMMVIMTRRRVMKRTTEKNNDLSKNQDDDDGCNMKPSYIKSVAISTVTYALVVFQFLSSCQSYPTDLLWWLYTQFGTSLHTYIACEEEEEDYDDDGEDDDDDDGDDVDDATVAAASDDDGDDDDLFRGFTLRVWHLPTHTYIACVCSE